VTIERGKVYRRKRTRVHLIVFEVMSDGRVKVARAHCDGGVWIMQASDLGKEVVR